MTYEDKNKIYQRAKRIVDNSILSWEEKYDLIFSDEISKKFKFDWYDPDCGYQEDVMGYMSGFDEYMSRQLIINEIGD